MLVRDATPPERLSRKLGLWSATFLVIGITIGSGIFRTPAAVAGRVPDASLMLLVWVIGGLMTLAGALAFAELASSLPHAGGPYVFLREGLGRPAAFLYGWTQLVLLRATSLAAIGSVFGEYLLRSMAVDPSVHSRAADHVAVAGILTATVANVVGTRVGASMVGLTTAAKYLGLAAIVVCALAFGGGHGGSVEHFQASAGPVTVGMFGLALVSVLWAYDGFADLSFAGGEVADPRRNLPRALTIGTLSIVAIYLLANVAYLYVLPLADLPTSRLVAADAMSAIFGQPGATLVSLLVMVSTFGTLNGVSLTAPRIFFAMAEDRLLFRQFAAVHPRFGTPYVAVVFAGIVGAVMVLTRSFEQLTFAFVLGAWPFHLLSVVALYRLRRTRPDLVRPGSGAGRSLVPAVFGAAAVFLILNALVSDPVETGAVFGVILLGLPVYWIVGRVRAHSP